VHCNKRYQYIKLYQGYVGFGEVAVRYYWWYYISFYRI